MHVIPSNRHLQQATVDTARFRCAWRNCTDDTVYKYKSHLTLHLRCHLIVNNQVCHSPPNLFSPPSNTTKRFPMQDRMECLRFLARPISTVKLAFQQSGWTHNNQMCFSRTELSTASEETAVTGSLHRADCVCLQQIFR